MKAATVTAMIEVGGDGHSLPEHNLRIIEYSSKNQPLPYVTRACDCWTLPGNLNGETLWLSLRARHTLSHGHHCISSHSPSYSYPEFETRRDDSWSRKSKSHLEP